MRRIAICPLCLLLVLAATVGCQTNRKEAAKLADLLDWTPGQTIAEIGAGMGEMSFEAAAKVGDTGHVYTTELDESKLAQLRKQVQQRKLKNVEVVKADQAGTNLPDACCNSIFMRRVYHHFTDPKVTDAALLKALKPGGLLAVIDFVPRRNLADVENLPPGHHGHGLEGNIVVKELQAAGFAIQQQPSAWLDGDYCVVARKPIPMQQ